MKFPYHIWFLTNLVIGPLLFAWFAFFTVWLWLKRPHCTPLMNPRPNTKHIVGLRWFAATFIVACHMLEPGPGTPWDRDHPIFYAVLIRGGNVQVSLFVLMSGFFTHVAYTRTLQTAGWGCFYLKRIVKILPLFYIAHFASVFVRIHYGNPEAWHTVITSALFITEWSRKLIPTMPNRMLWTVSVLVQIWLVFPMLHALLLRWRARANAQTYFFQLWIFGVMVPMLLAQIPAIYYGSNPIFDQYAQMKTFPPVVFLPFLCGVCVAEAVMHMPEKRESMCWQRFCDLSAFGIMALIWVVPFAIRGEAYFHGEIFWLNGSIGCWAIVLMTSVWNQNSYFARIMSFKVFILLGEYSIGLYCLQDPVCMVLRHLMGGTHADVERQPLDSFTFQYVVLLAVAVAVNEFVEKPWAGLIKRWADRAQQTTPETVPIFKHMISYTKEQP